MIASGGNRSGWNEYGHSESCATRRRISTSTGVKSDQRQRSFTSFTPYPPQSGRGALGGDDTFIVLLSGSDCVIPAVYSNRSPPDSSGDILVDRKFISGRCVSFPRAAEW